MDLFLELSASFAASVIRVSTPVIFAALGAVVAESAGTVNIALEGIMLTSALMGVVVSAFTGSALVGLFCGMVSGVFMGLILGFFHLRLKANAVLIGIALNLIASQGTVFLLYVITGEKGVSTSLASKAFPQWQVPGLKGIPIIGSILDNQNALTYLAFGLVAVVFLVLFKTPFGFRLRAVGENPDAAINSGITVHRLQFVALALSGGIASLGGIYLSMGYVSWFSRDMVAGRGFIGLAAAVLGRRNLVGALAASIAFGFADALSNYMQSLRTPKELVQMIPYISTVVALAVYSARQSKVKTGGCPND